MSGILYAVGVGPGDPELLTLKAVKTIRAADVIACPAKDHLPGLAYQIAEKAVPEISLKEKLLTDFPMMKEVPEETHRAAAESILPYLRAGKNVVFLTLGDPGLYSTFSYISDFILQEGCTVEMISGIPSFCAVSARLLLPLASGEEPVMITTGEYRDFSGTLIIMKAGRRLRTLKRDILSHGKEAFLVENCGMDNESVYSGIDSIPDEAGYFSTLIVK